MKKIIRYSLFIGLVCIFSSCLREEKDLFPESAALRLNHAIDNVKQLLIDQSNNNGWIMEYFPTNGTEGYTFLMSFSSNTFVTIAAKNKYTSVYTTDESSFDVLGDAGPVLTFDTYNSVFHLFSNPVDPQGGNTGIGLGGDYEFIVMNIASDNVITLKGKKRGTTIVMRPLAQGQDWKAYFDSLDNMDATVFNPKLPITLTLKGGNAADSLYYLTNGASHIFTAKTQKAIDAGDPGTNIPFIITDYGLRFAQPVAMGEDSVQTFKLSDDKSKLVCIDKDVQAEIFGEDLSSLFLNAQTVLWAFVPSSLSDRMASVYNRIVNSCIDVYQAESVTMGIGYSIARRSFELRLLFVRNAGKQTLTGNLSLSASTSGNSNDISFQATGTGDNNGITFSTRIDGYQEMADLISQRFLLSTDVAINPANMKFIQVDGNEVWFLTNCQ